MEKLLTIVVPAYNVEKYIKNCLDSFIDLSVLRSLEILIVDDGSTDSTASLAHTYEQKYPYSFKVLSKENGGHGSTINYAIPRATGKYFKVVDGDDWLDKSLLPQFVQLLKHTHSDVISNDFNLVDDRTKKVTKRRKAVSNSYHYNREWGFAEAVMGVTRAITVLHDHLGGVHPQHQKIPKLDARFVCGELSQLQ